MTLEQEHLLYANYVVRDCPDCLSESMVRALVKNGYRSVLEQAPADVVAQFRYLLEESDNPVPE